MKKLFIEAIMVGIIIMITGTGVTYLMGNSFSVELPPVCDDWNKNYVMEISLFLTGFLGHLLLEYFKVNKWYCINGTACQKI